MGAVAGALDEPVVPEEHGVEEAVIPGAPEELGETGAGAPVVGVSAVDVDAILETDEALAVDVPAADVPVVDEKAVASEMGMAKDKLSVPPTE